MATSPAIRPSSGSTRADGALTLLGNGAFGAISTVTGFLAARILGPSGRGELAAIFMWPSFLGVLALLGMSESIVYFSARERGQAGRIFGSAAVIALSCSLIFMAAGYLALPRFLAAQPAWVIRFARIYLLQIPVSVLLSLFLSTLRGTDTFKLWNNLRLISPVIWLTVLACSWMLESRDPTRIALSYLVLTGASVFPIAVLVRNRILGGISPQPERWIPMLRYGLPCVMTAVPMVLNLRMDQMLMAALLPARQLGLYAAAASWSGAIGPMTGAVGLVLFPKVASKDTPQSAQELVAKGVRVGTLLASLAGAALLILTPVGLPLLFGARFAVAVPSALILVFAGIFSGWNLAMSAGLRGLGFPTAVLIAESSGLAVTAVGLWLVLRPWGIIGAAFVSLFAYGTTSILLAVQAHSLTTISFRSLLLPRRSELRSGLLWLRDQTYSLVSPHL